MENHNIVFHPVFDNGKIAFDIPLSGSEIVEFSKAYLCTNFVVCREGMQGIAAKVKVYGCDDGAVYDMPKPNGLSSLYDQFMKKAEE